MTTVTGLGTATLNFTRPLGSSKTGCDDYALEATGPITVFQVASAAPVSGRIGFIPNETLRTRFDALVQAPAAAAVAGAVASVPTLEGGLLAALGVLLAATARFGRRRGPV